MLSSHELAAPPVATRNGLTRSAEGTIQIKSTHVRDFEFPNTEIVMATREETETPSWRQRFTEQDWPGIMEGYYEPTGDLTDTRAIAQSPLFEPILRGIAVDAKQLLVQWNTVFWSSSTHNRSGSMTRIEVED